MTVQDFLLPDLGEGLTEGTIVEWLVEVGDTVTVDQAVVQVETAKAVVDVPCPFAGEVTALHAETGQEVEVGEALLSIRTGEGGDAVEGDEADGGASGSVLVGYGTAGDRARRRQGRREAQGSPNGHASTDAGGPASRAGRPLAKPPVRKLAKDLGVDLWQVEPSGPDGVITREDVHSAAAGAGVAEAAGQPAAVVSPADAETGDREPERIPLTGVRKRIAERMRVSRTEIPEATTWVDCDATDLMRARDEINERQDAVRVSPLAILLKACIAGLRRHPDLNSTFDAAAGEIVRHRAVHLGVAVQTERGLLVPVIRDADRRSLLELAEELGRLTAAARDGGLGPEALTGSTFTVSNYGSFGVDGGNPVINHPEVAILGVGQIADRPWVTDGEVRVRKVCQLSVAFDHRVCDGADAAGFLRFVADCAESTATLLATL